MKPIILTFFLIFYCSINTHAQKVSNLYTAQIDSIQLQLNKRPTADTLCVLQLNELARVCFKDLQFKRGLLATKQARSLAKKLNFEKGEGLYLVTMAEFNDDSFLWLYYYYKSIWFYVDRNRPASINSINSYTPPEHTDVEKANQELMTALVYFTKYPDAEMRANILQLISLNYLTLNKDAQSMAYLDQAFKQFQQAKLPMAAYLLVAYKSLFLERRGKKQEAKLAQRAVNKFVAAHPDNRETALIYIGVSSFYRAKNDIPLAYESQSKANLLLERLGEQHLRIRILESLGNTYIYLIDLPGKAIDFYLEEKKLAERVNDKENLAWIYHKVAFTLIKLKRFDEAAHYVEKAKKIIDISPDSFSRKQDLAQHYDALGQLLMGRQKYQEAISNFNQAFEIIKTDIRSGKTNLDIYFNLYVAQCYQKMGNLNQSINYGLQSYRKASTANTIDGGFVTPKVCRLLFENYDSLKNHSEAYKFLKLEHTYQKQIEEKNAANRLAEMEIQSIVLKSEQEKNRLQQARLLKEQENQNQRWWLFSIGAALLTAIVLAVILYRNNQHKQKANALLHRQKEEIDRQRDKAEIALDQLQSTQAQLIQKEKLASLGELTAGIAHEIQNPLNFVNNFSEVSHELVDELEEELDKGDTLEAKAIASSLRQNLQKIHHHGGRASSIVKGMLEHSRTESGEKRPTGLNALADEYLQIAYHGLRAKDKSFNCELITDFDTVLKPVDVAPQEIGRVLLNLYNNAFYSVGERAKQTADPDYKPTVEVRTQQQAGKLVIQVRDNGTGIPESVKAKIFQPFFTTKPTGEGTGLGLSLSYDIITKGHGGTLTVESIQGQGTLFSIYLPTPTKA